MRKRSNVLPRWLTIVLESADVVTNRKPGSDATVETGGMVATYSAWLAHEEVLCGWEARLRREHGAFGPGFAAVDRGFGAPLGGQPPDAFINAFVEAQ